MYPTILADCVKCGKTSSFTRVHEIPEGATCLQCKNNSSEFINIRHVYEEICPYCTDFKHFEEYSEKPICPTCGFEIKHDEGDFNPAWHYKSLRADMKQGNYFGLWMIIAGIIGFLLIIYALK